MVAPGAAAARARVALCGALRVRRVRERASQLMSVAEGAEGFFTD